MRRARRSYSARFAFSIALGIIPSACRDADPEPPCFVEFELEPEPGPLYSAPTPCDPLVAPTSTPRIQPPVIVGEADDGLLYVLDRMDGGFMRPEVDRPLVSRFFVEEDGVLVRTSGGVGSSESTMQFIYDAFGASHPKISGMTRVERKPGYPPNIIPSETAMVFFERPVTGGPYPSDVFDEGTPLHVLSECAVADYAVEDLPQGRHIEYVADDESGNHILVTVPDVDWDVESCKLFYGPPDAVLERPVRSFARERDGGTTHISFVLDGVEATLHFWYGCNGPFTSDCEGTLELPSSMLSVSIPTRDESMLAGHTYVCHDQPPPSR